jgi:hypothetical protein
VSSIARYVGLAETSGVFVVSFWKWFFKGSGGRRGCARLRDWWILLHIGVGAFFVLVVPADLKEAANAVLLPLAGTLIGLCFAWAGNAVALLQTDELEELSQHSPGGFEDYAYVFQLAILVMLVTLVAWGLAGLNVFDKVWPSPCNARQYAAMKGILGGLCSASLRECWNVVGAGQEMLLARSRIRKQRKSHNA